MKKPKVKIKLKTSAMDVSSEHIEQCKVVAFCENYPQLRNIFRQGNGGKRSIVSAMKAKAEGEKNGIPDLFLPLPTSEYHGLFIEMKKLKGGVVSEYQKDWLERLNTAGYKAVVCKGHLEAISVLCEYINVNNPYQAHE